MCVCVCVCVCIIVGDLEELNSVAVWVRFGFFVPHKKNIADIDIQEKIFYKYAVLTSVLFNIRPYLSDTMNIRKNTFGKFVCRLISVVLR